MKPPVTAVVPLKALSMAKTRLAGEVGEGERRDVVAWMLRRVVAACRGSGWVSQVLVVAGDDAAAGLAVEAGADVLLVRQPGLRTALDRADARIAGAPASIVVAADLPDATEAAIDAVFVAAAQPPDLPVVAVAPTVDGGTGALLRRPATVISTAYGPDSAARHLALARQGGIRAMRVEVPALRHDVDTPLQLRAALAAHGGSDVALDAPATKPGSRVMPQGTVKYFDPITQTGTILLDNQDELPVDAETFAASGLNEMRLGQRMRFELEGSGDNRRLRSLNLVSF